jgi:hypothetical protein
MNSRQVVEKPYDFQHHQTLDGIAAACAQDAARTLLRIEILMRSLGADGLHTLIQLAAKDARRRDRRRRARRVKK